MCHVDPDIPTEDATDALLTLARLLGRIAAKEAVDQATLDCSPPQSQQKGNSTRRPHVSPHTHREA